MRQFVITLVVFFVSFFYTNNLLGEDKKIIAVRTDSPPKIDGILDEDVWTQSNVASNFFMLNPGDGTPERNNQKTIVYILYDNTAIYVGAKMYDNEPRKIPCELGQRDDSHKNSDLFILSINPYNDGQQVFNFTVTAAGVQIDTKYVTGGHDDVNWNAVWDSEVVIGDDGWVVEMKIPYSELRFPEKKEQIWGINFLRSQKRINEEYTWNYINKSVGDYTQHYGELRGIVDIKPPTRLSFMPYISGYVDDYDESTNYSYNLGMDLKYGINESFTLDMTLIPDFGQSAYDEQVLNLSPFEVQYDEKRQFFTEGTEMFGKGNLFYSRRIGGVPTKYYDIANDTDLDNYEVLENPTKTPLINATKVSGRTQGGLGIGVFNAVTNKTIAKVKNVGLEISEIDETVTEPLANYNVIVLDQRFNNNSSVTLINTNVLRDGDFRDANVTGLLYDISNKGNSYKLFGEIKYSQVYPKPDSLKQGAQIQFGLAKTKGKFRFEHATRLTTENYDNTDLGYMRYSNIWEIDTEFSYQIFEPIGNYNFYKFVFGIYHDRQYKSDHFIKTDFLLTGVATTKNNFSYGGNVRFSPYEKYDYYEPRVEGRYLIEPAYVNVGMWFSTDYGKKFAVDLYVSLSHTEIWNKNWIVINFTPRYRINDKLVVSAEINRFLVKNSVGWVNVLDNDDIIMGVRNQKNLISAFNTSYTFNNKMSIELKFRHYWADIEYSDYKKLTNNGSLKEVDYSDNHNTTFNSWNLDLSYSWWFAPGSQVSVLYRNSLLSSLERAGFGYADNLEKMFENPIQNTFSVKLVYYIDYNNIKNMF